MDGKYFPPVFDEQQFNCPYCNVFSRQTWSYVNHFPYSSSKTLNGFKTSSCYHCDKIAIWFNEKMIIPAASTAPLPHVDLPEGPKMDYLEAREIVNQSPRGAAALLRLSLQKLMKELGESGTNINADIASLVSKGLPEEVQQALDYVRVIGNEAVHPGELDLQDDLDTANTIFEAINFIVDEQISKKKRISEFYNKLPQNKRDYIAQRDGVSP